MLGRNLKLEKIILRPVQQPAGPPGPAHSHLLLPPHVHLRCVARTHAAPRCHANHPAVAGDDKVPRPRAPPPLLQTLASPPFSSLAPPLSGGAPRALDVGTSSSAAWPPTVHGHANLSGCLPGVVHAISSLQIEPPAYASSESAAPFAVGRRASTTNSSRSGRLAPPNRVDKLRGELPYRFPSSLHRFSRRAFLLVRACRRRSPWPSLVRARMLSCACCSPRPVRTLSLPAEAASAPAHRVQRLPAARSLLRCQPPPAAMVPATSRPLARCTAAPSPRWSPPAVDPSLAGLAAPP